MSDNNHTNNIEGGSLYIYQTDSVVKIWFFLEPMRCCLNHQTVKALYMNSSEQRAFIVPRVAVRPSAFLLDESFHE